MGHARAGKDTAASGLQALGFVRRSFADPLKEAALAALRGLADIHPVGACVEALDRCGWEWAKDNTTWARPYLQAFGTDAIRTLDPDFWIRTALDGLDTPAVFPDCRFANEVAAIRARGGIILRVDRPGTAQANSHASEVEWQTIEPDSVLVNGGTPGQLRTLAAKVVGRLLR